MSTDFLPEFLDREFKPATTQDMAFLPLLLHGLGNPQPGKNYQPKTQPWSKHPGRRVFSIVTGLHNQVMAIGYNGLPHLESDPLKKDPSASPGSLPDYRDEEPYYRIKPAKALHVECAECNCCNNAEHTGTYLGGATIRLNWFPCAPCAKRIVKEGISTVVALVSPTDFAGKCDWSKSFAESRAILASADIEVRIINAAKIGLPDLMKRRPDLPPVPSGSTDWDKRYLDLATFAEKTWGCGEVIARAPLDPGEPHEKIVRAIGAVPGRRPLGALEVAEINNTFLEDCTLYSPTMPSLQRAFEMARRGIAAIKIAAPLPPQAADIGKRTGLIVRTTWVASVVPLDLSRRRLISVPAANC